MHRYALINHMRDGFVLHAAGCADLTRGNTRRRIQGEPEITEAETPAAAVDKAVEDLENSGFEKGSWTAECFRIMPCCEKAPAVDTRRLFQVDITDRDGEKQIYYFFTRTLYDCFVYIIQRQTVTGDFFGHKQAAAIKVEVDEVSQDIDPAVYAACYLQAIKVGFK